MHNRECTTETSHLFEFVLLLFDRMPADLYNDVTEFQSKKRKRKETGK